LNNCQQAYSLDHLTLTNQDHFSNPATEKTLEKEEEENSWKKL